MAAARRRDTASARSMVYVGLGVAGWNRGKPGMPRVGRRRWTELHAATMKKTDTIVTRNGWYCGRTADCHCRRNSRGRGMTFVARGKDPHQQSACATLVEMLTEPWKTTRRKREWGPASRSDQGDDSTRAKETNSNPARSQRILYHYVDRGAPLLRVLIESDGSQDGRHNVPTIEIWSHNMHASISQVLMFLTSSSALRENPSLQGDCKGVLHWVVNAYSRPGSPTQSNPTRQYRSQPTVIHLKCVVSCSSHNH